MPLPFRYHYNGLSSNFGAVNNTPAPWEITKIVYPHQATSAFHPSAFHATTNYPALVITDLEGSPLDNLQLDNIDDTQGLPGIIAQAEILNFARDAYPEQNIGIYGVPSVDFGWFPAGGGGAANSYLTWQASSDFGTAAPIDAVNMRTNAKLLADIMMGNHENAEDMLTVNLDCFCPSMYVSRVDINQAAQWTLVQSLVGTYMLQYIRSHYGKRMKLVPFINGRKNPVVFPDPPEGVQLCTESEFITAYCIPFSNMPALTGVYYWSVDGLTVSAAAGGDPHELAHVLAEIPPELAVEPYDWAAIQQWYNDKHTSYMALITEYVTGQT